MHSQMPCSFLGKSNPFFITQEAHQEAPCFGGRRLPRVYSKPELDGLSQQGLPRLMLLVLTTTNLGQNNFFLQFWDSSESHCDPAPDPAGWDLGTLIAAGHFFAASVVWCLPDPFPWWCWIARPWIYLQRPQAPAKRRQLCSTDRQAMHGHGHGTEMAREVKGRSLQGSVANPAHAWLASVCPLNHSPPVSFWEWRYVCWW